MDNQMNNNNNNNNRGCSDRGYIVDTLIKIDRMQKAASINDEADCITCQNSLLSVNNTVPLSFILCGGAYLTSNIGVADTPTIYYKIEAIRCERYVTLRLLEDTDGVLTATEFTLTLDTNCVCALQCYPPITTTSCNLRSS